MSAAGYDRGEARAFLDTLFTDAPGLAQVVTLGPGGNRWTHGADLDALADWAPNTTTPPKVCTCA